MITTASAFSGTGIQFLPDEATFKVRFARDALLRSVVSDIDEVERKVAAATAPRGKLEELISKMFSGKTVTLSDTQIEIKTKDKDSVPLGLLSSGEKQVLRLLVEVLRVEENAILIDEPELSMHIDWQRELVAHMRQLNPEAQLIIATHSPEIMAEVPDQRIYKL
jgi:predicted ATPase